MRWTGTRWEVFEMRCDDDEGEIGRDFTEWEGGWCNLDDSDVLFILLDNVGLLSIAGGMAS
eukprot:m.86854 g.86854  ORF g.86854 m.86854 type:complete len:61 (+) comp8773_c1_seq1:1314-1496(+)